MQIVINISEKLYDEIKRQSVPLPHIDVLCESVLNGTPLPEGHGRLIDAEALDMKRIDYIVDGYANDKDDCKEFGMMIILAPTLVEADGGDAE